MERLASLSRAILGSPRYPSKSDCYCLLWGLSNQSPFWTLSSAYGMYRNSHLLISVDRYGLHLVLCET